MSASSDGSAARRLLRSDRHSVHPSWTESVTTAASAFRRSSPTVFLSQYTDRDIATFDERVVDLPSAEFVDAVGGRRPGVATEFRLLGESWGFDVDEVDRPVRLWHGTGDTNVPLAGVRQLGERLPNSRLTTVDGDHLSTLLDCRERVLAAHGSGGE